MSRVLVQTTWDGVLAFATIVCISLWVTNSAERDRSSIVRSRMSKAFEATKLCIHYEVWHRYLGISSPLSTISIANIPDAE